VNYHTLRQKLVHLRKTPFCTKGKFRPKSQARARGVTITRLIMQKARPNRPRRTCIVIMPRKYEPAQLPQGASAIAKPETTFSYLNDRSEEGNRPQ
jgi:hypothetical protein